MKRLISFRYSITFILFLNTFGCTPSNRVIDDGNFCLSLENEDKRKTIDQISDFLKDCNSISEKNLREKSIINWFNEKLCIENAKFSNKVMLTSPPQQKLHFEYINSSGVRKSMIVSISMNQKKYTVSFIQ